jgi:hypothetical protein
VALSSISRTMVAAAARARWERHPRLAGALVALGCYVLMVILVTPHPEGVFSADRYIGIRSDPTLYIWGFAWLPYALTHGMNPLVTHLIWAPRGADIAWNGDTPGLAVLAWPLTALIGPIAAFNVVTLGAPMLAALSAYALCYEITDRLLPSLVGGWLFGFSTYEVAQLLGHLQVNFIAEVPLLLLLAVLRYRRRIGAPMFVVGSMLILILEFGVGIELYTTTAVFAVVGLVVAYILVKQSRGAITRIACELGGAYGASVLILSPYLYFLLRSASAVPAIIHSPVKYSADLLNFVVPTPVTALGGSLLSGVTRHFTGNLAENDAYLGLPLILIVFLLAWQGRREKWVRVLAVCFLIVGVAELGPRLPVLGNTAFAVGVVHLPWYLFTKIPGIRDALPGRFAMYLSLLAAIMASLWIASLNRTKILGIALVVAAVVLLWPSALTVSTPPSVKLLSSKAYLAVLPPRTTLLFLPYGSLGDSMLWQALDDLRYRAASGTGTIEPESFVTSPAVRMFFAGTVPVGYRADITSFCRQHQVTAVLVTSGTVPALESAIATMGWPSQVLGSDRIYWVPSAVNN